MSVGVTAHMSFITDLICDMSNISNISDISNLVSKMKQITVYYIEG